MVKETLRSMAKRKLAVVTRADDNWKVISVLTHPILHAYAESMDADFVVLSKLREDCEKDRSKYHFRILDQYNLFEEYDRILHIDSDVIIAPDCPNIFNVVPEDKIGTILEDKGTRRDERLARIREVQNHWGGVGWTEGYINTGVFVASKQHRDIFKKYKNKYWEGEGEDDVHIGYLIHLLGHHIHELSYKFNHMSMFSEPWNNSPSRHDSHCIHYAGNAEFPDIPGLKNPKIKAYHMAKDIEKLFKL
jgi:hypothetical protein